MNWLPRGILTFSISFLFVFEFLSTPEEKKPLNIRIAFKSKISFCFLSLNGISWWWYGRNCEQQNDCIVLCISVFLSAFVFVFVFVFYDLEIVSRQNDCIVLCKKAETALGSDSGTDQPLLKLHKKGVRAIFCWGYMVLEH